MHWVYEGTPLKGPSCINSLHSFGACFYKNRGHSKNTFVGKGRRGFIEKRTKMNMGRTKEGGPSMCARSLF